MEKFFLKETFLLDLEPGSSWFDNDSEDFIGRTDEYCLWAGLYWSFSFQVSPYRKNTVSSAILRLGYHAPVNIVRSNSIENVFQVYLTLFL